LGLKVDTSIWSNTPMHWTHKDYDTCSLLATCHKLDGSNAQEQWTQPSPNQCMNARFQVAEKI